MTITLAPWDSAEILKTKEHVIAYLDAVLEDGDPKLIKLALGSIARSKGMTEIARETGIRRTSLYRALSPEGNPEFATVAGVLKALGLRLSVAPGVRPKRAAAAKSKQVRRRKGAAATKRAGTAKARAR
jgi:probable addiction module antidote protein